MHKSIYFLVIFSLLLGCSEQLPPEPQPTLSTPPINPQEYTQAFDQWLDEQYQEALLFRPMNLTTQGSKILYDTLDDFSEQAIDERLAWRAGSVEAMQSSFDYESLTAEGKMSWDLWEYGYQVEIAQSEARYHSYIFHQMGGRHASLPTFLMSYHSVASEADMLAYVSRLSELGRAIEQLISRAKTNAEAGTRPPRFAYEIVSEEAAKVISGVPFDQQAFDSPLYADAKSKINQLVEQGDISAERADAILGDTQTVLVERVKPAYEALIGFLQADIGNTEAEALGVSALPDGEAFYAHRLALMTTTDMSADTIHQLGLREVERLRGEMEAIVEQVAFDGTLAEFFVYIRESTDDPRFYFPQSDEGRQGYLDAATQAIENIKSELPRFFATLPRADLEVRRVERFREQDGGAQHYYIGTPDGSRPGIYYAHLSDMEAMPINELEVIAYHEGLPGHHMQLSIAQELTTLPLFRTQARYTAYIEGWALYSEYLATEMNGTYQDPYSEFGRLSSEIWRAIRLVVDTGLHVKGWSQQQAVDYFLANSPTPRATAESEVRRYLVLPGQATSYKIGMLEIQRLRAHAEAELGERFDIRQFHDVVLTGGALPLSFLQQRVEHWIDAQ